VFDIEPINLNHREKLMKRATWNGTVIASAADDEIKMVEGNLYFPPHALKLDYLQPSEKVSTCGWKGEAHYYNVVVEGQTNADAAWYYATPLNAAREIAGHVAFWRGILIED